MITMTQIQDIVDKIKAREAIDEAVITAVKLISKYCSTRICEDCPLVTNRGCLLSGYNPTEWSTEVYHIEKD